MSTSPEGRFITLEGGEGAGKSTMMRRTERWLREAGYEVITSREPGGTPLAEQIRGLVLDTPEHDGTDTPAELTELLLMFAARAQHLERIVRPALASGTTVLCDRFTDATWAYQGAGRHLNSSWIATLEQLVHGDLQPHLTILLDLDVETGLNRAASRSDPDWFERENVEFFERVRKCYLERAQKYPERFAVVDASGTEDGVWRLVEQVLEERVSRP